MKGANFKALTIHAPSFKPCVSFRACPTALHVLILSTDWVRVPWPEKTKLQRGGLFKLAVVVSGGGGRRHSEKEIRKVYIIRIIDTCVKTVTCLGAIITLMYSIYSSHCRLRRILVGK
jgi:hypothetical protein